MNTLPLEFQLKQSFKKACISLQKQLNTILPNYKVELHEDYFIHMPEESETLDILSSIPSEFWRLKCFDIPTNQCRRMHLSKEVTNGNHFLMCSNEKFHLPHYIQESWVCLFCVDEMNYCHENYCIELN